MTIPNRELDRLFQALSDTTRRGILMRIREGDRTVNDIASQFDISLPAVSKHLSILERAGLLTRRKEGRKRICHVEPQQLHSATEWLEFYQSFWIEQLENLKQFVETDADDTTHRRKK
jgi:DNA-binding transcriptional ArsR family regulator